MPTAYLFCPAYPLRDQQQVFEAEETAQQFAVRSEIAVASSPRLALCGLAGSWPNAPDRIADFHHGCSFDILIAARGGYGCVDLIDAALSAERLPRLIGFSDLTVLHACWRVRSGPETYYGFMPSSTRGPQAQESTAILLNGSSLNISEANHPTSAVLREGIVDGWVFAACLRVLASLCGTKAMPNLTGCLLALEDIDERPYQIDRDLSQLYLSGALMGVRGLIFGTFRCPSVSNYSGPEMTDILARWAHRLKIPTIYGVGFGHDSDPVTLACGRSARLEAHSSAWSLAFASL